jgi:hypothetical protein
VGLCGLSVEMPGMALTLHHSLSKLLALRDGSPSLGIMGVSICDKNHNLNEETVFKKLIFTPLFVAIHLICCYTFKLLVL